MLTCHVATPSESRNTVQTSITLITTGPSISYPYPYRPSYPSSGKVSKHIVRLRTQRLPQPQRSKGLSREGGQGTGGGRTEGPRRLLPHRAAAQKEGLAACAPLHVAVSRLSSSAMTVLAAFVRPWRRLCNMGQHGSGILRQN